MNTNIIEYLKTNSVNNFLSMKNQNEAMKLFNLKSKDVEKQALEIGITPLRYKRNQSTINLKSQLKLLDAHVCIIGCGGLGGHVAEILTRIGIGNLTLIDFDIFEEHNLNRQNFSNYETLGMPKVLVVKENLEKINPVIHIETYIKKFDVECDFELISKCDVVVDALDNPKIKLALAKACKESNINFVHGAIAGMNGQFSSNSTLEHEYRNSSLGIEQVVGNPSFSVTFAASIQSAEVIKILLNIGEILDKNILITNLLENEFILV